MEPAAVQNESKVKATATPDFAGANGADDCACIRGYLINPVAHPADMLDFQDFPDQSDLATAHAGIAGAPSWPEDLHDNFFLVKLEHPNDMEPNHPTYSVDADTNESVGDPIVDSAGHPADVPGPDELPEDTLVTAGATGRQGAEVVSRVTSMLIDLRRFPTEDLRLHPATRKALDSTIQAPVDMAVEHPAHATAMYIYTDGSSTRTGCATHSKTTAGGGGWSSSS